MSSRRSPEVHPRPLDAAVVLAVAALAAAVAVWFYGGLAAPDDGLRLVVTHRGQEVAAVDLASLEQQRTIEVAGEYRLTICAEADRVWVEQSDCPTQDCVHSGEIRRAGQSIVCLPEQVVIKLTGGASSGPDLILG